MRRVRFKTRIVWNILPVLFICAASSFQVFSQIDPAPTPVEPAVSSLRGISVGMTKAEVKEVLGKPRSSEKSSMSYSFSKNETAQISFDGKGRVRTIATIYREDDSDAPDPADIFGSDVAAAPGKNGKVYKLMRYPEAGFFIAYSRSQMPKGAMVVVTMGKIGK